MDKQNSVSNLISRLMVKNLGLMAISTIYFIAIKNQAYYIIDTPLYKIFLNKFVKLISIIEEVELLKNTNVTINDNNDNLSLAFNNDLSVTSFIDSKAFSFEYNWKFFQNDEWFNIGDNSMHLRTKAPNLNSFKIKLVVSTIIDGHRVEKESNIVIVNVTKPALKIILSNEYSFNKGDEVNITPLISGLNSFHDLVQWKWMYLHENEWFSFPLQITNRLQLHNLPFETDLLRVKLVAEFDKYRFESNETTIKFKSVNIVISNEMSVYENEITNLNAIVSLVNCEEKDLTFQWQMLNKDVNQWMNIIGENTKQLKFKANINVNATKYRLKVMSTNTCYFSNICTIFVNENHIKILRVKPSYNIKEGSTLSIVPEICIDHGSIINAKYQWQFKDGDYWLDVENQSGKNLLMSLVPIDVSGSMFRLLVDIDGKVASIDTTVYVWPLACLGISILENEINFSNNNSLSVIPVVQYENCNESDIVYQWMIKKEKSGWQNIKGQINKELLIENADQSYDKAFVKLVAWVDGRYFESNLSRLVLQSISIKINDFYEVVEKNNVFIKPSDIEYFNVDKDSATFVWETKQANGKWVEYNNNSKDLLFEKVSFDYNFLKLRLKAMIANSDTCFYSNESMIIVKENNISILIDNDYFFREGEEFLIRPSISFVNEDQEKMCTYQWQYKNNVGEWVNSSEYRSKDIYLDYTSLKWDNLFLRLVITCLGKEFYSNKSLVHVAASGSIKITFDQYEKTISNHSNLSIIPNIEICDVNDEDEIRYQWQFKDKEHSIWTNINDQNNRVLNCNNFTSHDNDYVDIRLTAIIDRKLFTSKSIKVNIVN